MIETALFTWEDAPQEKPFSRIELFRDGLFDFQLLREEVDEVVRIYAEDSHRSVPEDVNDRLREHMLKSFFSHPFSNGVVMVSGCNLMFLDRYENGDVDDTVTLCNGSIAGQFVGLYICNYVDANEQITRGLVMLVDTEIEEIGGEQQKVRVLMPISEGFECRPLLPELN